MTSSPADSATPRPRRAWWSSTRWRSRLLLAALLLWTLGGCGTPPAVESLIRVSGEVLDREADRLAEDARRARADTARQQAALATGFDRDLEARDPLDKPWVRDAVSAYVAAREAVALNGRDVEASYANRIDNLRAAHQAQLRALALIERHRAAWPWPASWDGWSLHDAWLGRDASLNHQGDTP
mgnify:CR=1 FL=1